MISYVFLIHFRFKWEATENSRCHDSNNIMGHMEDRNESIFNIKKPRPDMIVNDVKLLSFIWLSSRFSKISVDWNVWKLEL